jgi:hypothetical protein
MNRNAGEAMDSPDEQPKGPRGPRTTPPHGDPLKQEPDEERASKQDVPRQGGRDGARTPQKDRGEQSSTPPRPEHPDREGVARCRATPPLPR